MTDADRYVEAETISLAWLRAVEQLHAIPSRKAVHLMLRIADPVGEDLKIRAAAQSLIEDWNVRHPNDPKYDVLSTRNTMFPASWASRLPQPADLAEYYRDRYDRLRKHDSNNKFGTYFGRLVAYPRDEKHSGATADQLTELVRKLRDELKGPGPKSSRYEINIFSERHDTNTMSFPCLAHLSYHLQNAQLHQQAIYRNEYLVGRAYGNYLGLAQLQAYIAAACGLDVGEFVVTIGHVELDGRAGAVSDVLKALSDAP